MLLCICFFLPICYIYIYSFIQKQFSCPLLYTRCFWCRYVICILNPSCNSLIADFATAYQVMQSSNILPCREGQAGPWRQIITTSLRRHQRICLVWCIYPNIVNEWDRLVNEWNQYMRICYGVSENMLSMVFFSDQ